MKQQTKCPKCNTHLIVEGNPGEKVPLQCASCGTKGYVTLKASAESFQKPQIEELDFYPVQEPFAYVKILKDKESLDKYYKVIEPFMSGEESQALQFIQETLLASLNIRLDELDKQDVEHYLIKHIQKIIEDYNLNVSDILNKKILYYVKRDFLHYGPIDALMCDPHIEDISCDGTNVPIFLYHRKYGSLRSSIVFQNDEELSSFVIKLAQKCGKHISLAEPILDATMPDGSRIQMTLSSTVTAKGSTFTIRKFRADPITATDLIDYHTLSADMMAYLWIAVENGVSALIAGGTAAGKTSTLNAMSLFVPREAKIVSIEETREINLPHPNWIPGVARSGFGEIINDRLVGEIDLFDLMKAALRQRPEYIIVGEIRGREAYVLFQAMSTGHTTYSTFHADSTKSLIHRLESKPIDIPRIMLQALDIVTIQVNVKQGNKNLRRVKQIVEIVDIDPSTKEILTNEVFRWDPVEDRFIYSGKSYVLEKIRAQYDMSKEQMLDEIKRRVEILSWMRTKNIRAFKDVARVVASYSEMADDFMKKVRQETKTLEQHPITPPTPKKEEKTDKPVITNSKLFEGARLDRFETGETAQSHEDEHKEAVTWKEDISHEEKIKEEERFKLIKKKQEIQHLQKQLDSQRKGEKEKSDSQRQRARELLQKQQQELKEQQQQEHKEKLAHQVMIQKQKKKKKQQHLEELKQIKTEDERKKEQQKQQKREAALRQKAHKRTQKLEQQKQKLLQKLQKQQHKEKGQDISPELKEDILTIKTKTELRQKLAEQKKQQKQHKQQLKKQKAEEKHKHHQLARKKKKEAHIRHLERKKKQEQRAQEFKKKREQEEQHTEKLKEHHEHEDHLQKQHLKEQRKQEKQRIKEWRKNKKERKQNKAQQKHQSTLTKLTHQLHNLKTKSNTQLKHLKSKIEHQRQQTTKKLTQQEAKRQAHEQEEQHKHALKEHHLQHQTRQHIQQQKQKQAELEAKKKQREQQRLARERARQQKKKITHYRVKVRPLPKKETQKKTKKQPEMSSKDNAESRIRVEIVHKKKHKSRKKEKKKE